MTQLEHLPSWPAQPADVGAAIGLIKAALRESVESSGRSVAEVFSVVEQLVADRAIEIQQANDDCGTAWPVLDYADVESGAVSQADLDLVRRRGCLVIRGHFPKQQALDWDHQILNYVESNGFFEHYRGRGDDFFEATQKGPMIYPIYWSRPQMEARQHDRMQVVQQFLNSFWASESAGDRWFDPDRNIVYPDRIRRRPEGSNSEGLRYHLDCGKLDLWMHAEYQKAFRHVFDGSIESFDPWDAAHRTRGTQYESTTMTSVFRTFQGWTALSDMASDQGVLRAVPVPEAIAYLLLRPLMPDVPNDDMCGVLPNHAFRVTSEWHAPLLQAVSGIPDVEAGDSVWWHGDLVHGVAPVENQQGQGNVMYIPAAPWCERNERYAPSGFEAFTTGSSPSDFPEEHYERTWENRFQVADLNNYGRQAFGQV